MKNFKLMPIKAAPDTYAILDNSELVYIGKDIETANLILAAPDLLQALQDILTWDKNVIEDNGGRPHILNAINAINKATK